MKVLAVCGLGIGSSVILKINMGKILNEFGVKDYSLDVADIGTAKSTPFDIAITSVELADILKKSVSKEEQFRVIAITNFVDKDEMKEKVKDCLEKLEVL